MVQEVAMPVNSEWRAMAVAGCPARAGSFGTAVRLATGLDWGGGEDSAEISAAGSHWIVA